MRKNNVALLAVAVALAMLLAGCQPSENQEDKIAEQTIYTSFFPFYALSLPLLDGVPNIHLKCLVQPQDGCLRAYTLSDLDYAKLLSADAVIFGGRGMEGFQGALEAMGELGPARASVLDTLSLLGQDDPAPVEEDDQSHYKGANPWLFLSVEGAGEIAEQIAHQLATLDPSFEEMYVANLQKFQQKLDALHARVQDMMIAETPEPVALLHEGFPYIVEDLGLNAVCTIEREPGTEPYGRDLEEMMQKLEQSGAKVVLIEKQAPLRLRETLVSAGYHLAQLDTFQTYSFVISADAYEKTALANAEAVVQAFRKVQLDKTRSDML